MVVVIAISGEGPTRCRSYSLHMAMHAFEAHRLPLTISARHHSPTMMIDLTGSEKTTLNTFVERAITDGRHPPSPRIRTLDALVAELEPPPTVTGGRAPTIGQGESLSDDTPRRDRTQRRELSGATHGQAVPLALGETRLACFPWRCCWRICGPSSGGSPLAAIQHRSIRL
jgi:hypothetical protein